MRRHQLRMIVLAVVAVVILAALILEPPGTVEGVGYAVALLAMILVILRERRAR
jgi:hypothetical protein